MGKVTSCGLCGSDMDLAVILDLGEQPVAEQMGSDDRYPLALAECGNCGLIQLTYQVDPAVLFPPDHPYASGNTKALHDNFADLAGYVSRCAKPGDLIVDIGANDGTLLAKFSESFRRVAVEPTNQVRKAASHGIIPWQARFTAGVAHEIRERHGQAAIITATNVLAHVPDPWNFMEGVEHLLSPGGLFVTENHVAEAITEGLQIDTVYHEHYRYWSLPPLSRLLAGKGLTVIAAIPIPTHGGSLRVIARRQADPFGLQQRADTAALKLRDLLAGFRAGGDLVYGVGATTRAPGLIHFAGIADFIPCVCEIAGSEKIGALMPGTQIPVIDEEALFRDQPAYALLFSWHIASTLIPKLRADGYKGRFIVPLPDPVVIDG